MKVAGARKFLLTIPREHWDGIVSAAPALSEAASTGRGAGSKSKSPAATVHKWVATPVESNRYLLDALERYRNQILERLQRATHSTAHSIDGADPSDMDEGELLAQVSGLVGHAAAAVFLIASAGRQGHDVLSGSDKVMDLVADLPAPITITPWQEVAPWSDGHTPQEPTDHDADTPETQATSEHPNADSRAQDEPGDSEAIGGLRKSQEDAASAAQSISESVTSGLPVDNELLASIDAWNTNLMRAARSLGGELEEEVLPSLAAIEEASARVQALADEAAAGAARQQAYEEWQAQKELLEGELADLRSIQSTRPPDVAAALESSIADRQAKLAELAALEPHFEDERLNDLSSSESAEAPKSEPLSPKDTETIPTHDSSAAQDPSDMPRDEESIDAASVAPEDVELSSPGVVDLDEEETHAGDSRAADDEGAEDDEVQADSSMATDPLSSAPEEGTPQAETSPETDATSSALTELLNSDRFGAAFWLAEIAAPGSALAVSLRQLAGAFNTGEGGAHEYAVASALSSVEYEVGVSQDQAAAIILAVAAARVSLAGARVDSSLITLPGALPDSWWELLDAAQDVARQGYTYADQRSNTAEPERSEFLRLAQNLREDLDSSQLVYRPATHVLRYLMRDGQLLGQGLQDIETWSRGDQSVLPQLESLAKQLENPRAVDRLIDSIHADASAKKPGRTVNIEAKARQQLLDRISRVAGLVTEVLSHSSNRAPRSDHDGNRSHDSKLKRLARQVADEVGDPKTVSASAILALARWIDTPSADGRMPEIETILLRASLPLVEAQRDESQMPILSTIDAASAADLLLRPPSHDDLVERYLSLGNLALAQLCVASAVDELETAPLDDQDRAFEARAREIIFGLRTDFDRARMQLPFSPEQESALESQIESLQSISYTRCDLIDRRATAMRAGIEDVRVADARRVNDRLSTVPNLTDDDRDRIITLAQSGDLSTANEFLGFLLQGRSLPAADATEESHFHQFISAMAELPAGQHDASSVTKALAPEGADSDALASLGYLKQAFSQDAWRANRVSRPDGALKDLRTVLGLFGLTDPKFESVKSPQRNVRSIRTSAKRTDGSRVPGLGSRTSHYSLVVVLSQEDPARLIEIAEGIDKHAAHLILVPWLMTFEERRQLLVASRRKQTTALVIDAGVAGFLAARLPRSFKALQDVTLPYSVFRHYAPNFAGDVPEEVFVGREEQIAQITSPEGSLYVYGGRQLGKSAVLRKVQRDFDDGGDRAAIYIDLKSRGIGEFNEPEHIWEVLRDSLRERGILPKNISSGKPSSIVPAIRKWLDEDGSRRVLVLLDEADLFLEAESSARNIGKSQARFPNVLPLKELMDSSSRRFKVVFAGLHQVQRFSNISNSPLAHGGRDIEIGPLEQRSARQLVEEPLRWLGYELDSPDLVWRMLAFTNYQPGLVQIVCDQLISYMQKISVPEGAPPIRISATHVQQVLDNRDLRRQVAERFRLTISLEDTYRVMALVLAHHSLEDEFMVTYPQDFLLAQCASFWPEGFATMNLRNFRRYLEEMQGLGVLVVDADSRVAARSPNIVRLLGTPSEIEQELIEAEFTLPHEYNPRFTRRIVTVNRKSFRSPLTEDQLSNLIPVRESTPCEVHIVAGSALSGIDRVADTLEAVAHERSVQVRLVTPGDVAAELKQRDRSTVVVDARDVDTAFDLADLLGKLRQQADMAGRRSVVIVNERLVPAVNSAVASSPQLRVEPLELWDPEALRSWTDCPFDTSRDRQEVIGTTGGWPLFVEQVVSETQRGKALSSTLADFLATFAKPAEASSVLAQLGVTTPQESAFLQAWAGYTTPGSVVPADEADVLAELAGISPEEAETIIEEWILKRVLQESPGGLLLNEFVHRVVELQSSLA